MSAQNPNAYTSFNRFPNGKRMDPSGLQSSETKRSSQTHQQVRKCVLELIIRQIDWRGIICGNLSTHLPTQFSVCKVNRLWFRWQSNLLEKWREHCTSPTTWRRGICNWVPRCSQGKEQHHRITREGDSHSQCFRNVLQKTLTEKANYLRTLEEYRRAK
jgi:hypothetical protein